MLCRTTRPASNRQGCNRGRLRVIRAQGWKWAAEQGEEAERAAKAASHSDKGEKAFMNRYAFGSVVLALSCLGASPVFAQDKPCFESRKGASELTPHKLQDGVPSVKCSPKTG